MSNSNLESVNNDFVSLLKSINEKRHDSKKSESKNPPENRNLMKTLMVDSSQVRESNPPVTAATLNLLDAPDYS